MATKVKKIKSDSQLEGFDRVFPLIGGHHRYQWILMLITSLGGIQVFHIMGYAFLGATPDHWCQIEGLTAGNWANWTDEQIKNISIPQLNDGHYEQCLYYDLNYESLKLEPDFEAAYMAARRNFTTASTKSCSSWVYDASIYKSTVVTQFNLVCGRKNLVATIQATFMAGYFVGSLLGAVSDRILGRRGCILLGSGLIIAGGFGASFASSYTAFILFRFMIAIGAAGSFQNRLTILMEYCDASSRAAFGFIQGVPYCGFYMLMALYAYLVRDWQNLQLAFAVSTLSLISFYWFLPESSRWLASKNREEEAMDILEGIAKKNKRPVPNQVQLATILESCKDTEETWKENGSGQSALRRTLTGFKRVIGNYVNLVRTPELRRRSFLIWWLYISGNLVYYGISFVSPTLSSDPFIVVFLNGLVEIPANLSVIPLASKWGRKPTMASTFLASGLACIVVTFLPSELTWLRVACALAGKFLITGCFVVILLVATELFPTSERVTGFGAAALVARTGSIVAPYIANMKSVYKDLPSLIFAIAALLAGLVALMLPETKDADLVEHIDTVEEMAAGNGEAWENNSIKKQQDTQVQI